MTLEDKLSIYRASQTQSSLWQKTGLSALFSHFAAVADMLTYKMQILKNGGVPRRFDSTGERTVNVEELISEAEKLGFEQVGQFAIPLSRHDESQNDQQMLVYARPDGLLLAIDTNGDKPSGVKLHYSVQLSPFRRKTQAYKDLAYGSKGRATIGNHHLTGQVSAHKGIEPVLKAISILGELTPPMQLSRDAKFDFLLSEIDLYSQPTKYSLVTITHEKREKIFSELDAMKRERIDSLPLWVREMTGFEPVKTVKTPRPSSPSSALHRP